MENDNERLKRERLELLKMKQGLIEDSEIIVQNEHYIQPELKGKAWWSNFLYHHKIHIILIAFFSFIIVFMIHQTLTREKADLRVLVCTSKSYTLINKEIELAFEEYCPDFNGDGNIHVDVFDVYLNQNEINPDVFMANQTKLFGELAEGAAQIFIVDNVTYDVLISQSSDIFHNMKDIYPDSSDITEKGFAVKGSHFAKLAQWESVDDDVFFALRTEFKGMTSKESKVAKEQVKSIEVLGNIIFDRLITENNDN